MFSRRAVLPLTLLSLAVSASAQTMCDVRISMNSASAVTASGATGASQALESDAWGAERAGRVSVSHGIIRAYASAVSVDTFSNNGHFTWSHGTWQDDVTINAPGREGQTGRVRMAFTVDGSLSATNSGGSGVESSAQAVAEIRVNSDQGATFYDTLYPSSGLSSNVAGGFLNRQMTPEFTFTYGQPFHLWFQLRANAVERHETGVLNSSAVVDLEHTALWDGFSSVMDASGNSLSDFSVSSGSGINWSKAVTPVPEPTTLAGLALGGLALLRRRKR